jgi:hypothetical protein
MPLADHTPSLDTTTTRRHVLTTGAKLAYAAPVVAATMKLTTSGTAAISGGAPVCLTTGTCCPDEATCQAQCCTGRVAFGDVACPGGPICAGSSCGGMCATDNDCGGQSTACLKGICVGSDC